MDDDLVAEVMRRFGVSSKPEAVELAISWEGDLDEMRSDRTAFD